MPHITKEQLQHLAKLSRIEIAPETEESLLMQLEQIIEFVGQLDEIDVPDTSLATSTSLQPMADGEQTSMEDTWLANIHHPLQQGAIQITNQLSEK